MTSTRFLYAKKIFQALQKQTYVFISNEAAGNNSSFSSNLIGQKISWPNTIFW